MALVYVHLSDIHFGQEKGGLIIVNDDVKEQLIQDARDVVYSLNNKKADGIIISGDVAYAGKKAEYDRAGQWLDRLTSAVGSDRTAVQIVPGNHDIDLSLITNAGQTIIDDIAKRGDVALDSYLVSEQDREILYQRFSDYRLFADAYNCSLDGEGTISGHRKVRISEDRYIKFYGVNTALICSKSKTEEGSLLIGQRQRVIPTEAGVEVVVIAHHPLHWLQDSDDALKYIKNRARIFISGHEHVPSHKLENINDHADLLSLAAGATAPQTVTEVFNYSYNILEFDWDEKETALKIVVYPRMWNNDTKSFTSDSKHFKEDKCTFTLRCPNYGQKSDKKIIDHSIEVQSVPSNGDQGIDQTKIKMRDNQEKILLLKFFRDLSTTQRLQILLEMNALPESGGPINHNIEKLALKSIFSAGKHDELQDLINKVLSIKINKGDG